MQMLNVRQLVIQRNSDNVPVNISVQHWNVHENNFSHLCNLHNHPQWWC